MSIITFVVALLVIVALGWAAFWFVTESKMPDPMATIVRILVCIIGLIALYSLAVSVGHFTLPA